MQSRGCTVIGCSQLDGTQNGHCCVVEVKGTKLLSKLEQVINHGLGYDFLHHPLLVHLPIGKLQVGLVVEEKW